MRTKSTYVTGVIALALCIILGAQIAWAQQRGQNQGRRSENLIDRVDKDGDGKVSWAEFQEHFDRLDRDGDGYIESNELPQRGGNGQHPDSGGGRFIDRHDRDGDGQISRDEFPGHDEHFDRFDRNDDGTISEDEAPTGPPPGQQGQGGGRHGAWWS